MVSPSPFPPASAFSVARQSVAEQVLEELRHRVVLGEITPLMALTESKCAASLGVSRVPVREALFQLERDGLVALGKRNTLVARKLGETDWQEITAIRLQLEAFAAGLAASARVSADLIQLRQNVHAFASADSPEALARLDAEFHELLCAASHSQWLSAAWQTIRWPFEAMLVKNFRSYVSATCLAESKASAADHAHIVDALEMQNSAAAIQLLQQHITRWQEWTPHS